VSIPQGNEPKRSKYRILGLVGQGQFGRVYCAAHRQTGQLVALKSLEHHRFPTHKFLRELRFLLTLQHPHIVTCRALEHTATGRYLVMDYCEGGTLRTLMSDRQPLTLPQSLKLIVDILQGLDHAHNRGVVHCDIKPENILLNIQNQGWSARISDFGIARLHQELEGQGLGNTGSPAYMAPERFYGQYPLSSDLYAVGVLLFELLAGHRPFSGSPAELMSAHLNRPVQMSDKVPEAWQPIILTALQKLSARRFNSAREMLAAIRQVAAQEDIKEGLLQPSLSFAEGFSPWVSCQQEALKQPIKVLPSKLTEGGCLPRIGALFAVWPSFFPKNAIQNVLVRPQGLFVLTHRSLHLIPTVATPKLQAQLLLELPHDCVAAIAPQGQWCVTLENTRAGKLCFWKIRTDKPQMTLSRCSTIALQSLPILQPLLFALDAHHAAIITTTLEPQTRRSAGSSRNGTLVQVLTRRGNEAGLLQLPVRVGQAIATPEPYQLLATDADNPESILLIDIKPYRISRFSVGMVPKFLCAMPWGYIVADAQGRMVVLGQEGELLGQIQGPKNMTAIAPCNPHTIQIATWDGHRGHLYTSDLRELEVDMLF
jgi:serine/threonine protein kinase